jgi:hypothetical protein
MGGIQHVRLCEAFRMLIVRKGGGWGAVPGWQVRPGRPGGPPPLLAAHGSPPRPSPHAHCADSVKSEDENQLQN